MTLSPGSKLGPYQIEAPLGAGGMGEVYRATDPRLGRTVAIKVLPGHLTKRSDLRQRLEREARLISNLSHPHICALYDIGRENGIDFIVMEHLEGDSLADVLNRGRLTTEDTLRYGQQIASALDKAHRKGVIHRDLKPGNIMMTRSGVKLLDFGLAKLAEEESPPEADGLSQMATDAGTQKPLTAEGTVMGTFQYMAPEQLEGKEADPRSDIFSLGAVLYEMATGKRAFEGHTQASVIASILKEHPTPVSSVQTMTPPTLERLIHACLEKDPEDRIQTAHDVGLQMRWIAEGGSDVGIPVPAAARRKRRERIWMGTSILLAVLLVLTALFAVRQTRRPGEVLRLSMTPASGVPYQSFDYPVLSPDGTRLAFVAPDRENRHMIWIRDLSDPVARPLEGTEGATAPFWSPDSRLLGFVADNKLQKINAAGGPPQVLCATEENSHGGSWSSEGTILFSLGALVPLHKISAQGGEPERVTTVREDERGHWWPSFLPDGRHFVFLGDAAKAEGHHLKIGSLDSGESRDLVNAVSNFQFVKPDIVLFARGGTLLAQRLDMEKLELVGDPIALGENLTDTFGHYHDFSASNTGVLAYRSASPLSRLTWFDPAGRKLSEAGGEARIDWFTLSPDEQRVAFNRLDKEGRLADIWLLDLERGLETRFTLDPGSDGDPVWSPDGKWILWGSSREEKYNFYLKPTLGSGTPELILPDLNGTPLDWSPDGRTFLLYLNDPQLNMFAVAASGEEEPVEILEHLEVLKSARFSPTGRWIAFDTVPLNASQIYIQSYPGMTQRIQVSTHGGRLPRWSSNGETLYYSGLNDEIFAVELEQEGKLVVGAPRELFRVPNGLDDFEVTRDGSRFLIAQRVEDNASAPLTIVLNWNRLLDDR